MESSSPEKIRDFWDSLFEKRDTYASFRAEKSPAPWGSMERDKGKQRVQASRCASSQTIRVGFSARMRRARTANTTMVSRVKTTSQKAR